MKNLSYLIAGIIVTIILLLIYVSVQQSYRTGLNDPQIQIARELALQLENGRKAEAYIGENVYDITKSLSPFVVLYDAQGKPLRSNGFLDGKMPQVPLVFFEEVKKNAAYEVTWQPRKAVRIARVIVKASTMPVQYVASGR